MKRTGENLYTVRSIFNGFRIIKNESLCLEIQAGGKM